MADDILTCRARGRLLDIGTGPGWLLVKLHEKSSDLRLTGLDISAPMITTARKNIRRLGLSEHIYFREGTAAHLPFAGNSFDIVVSTGSLHHWKEPVRGLNEVYRVLCPGGYALIYDLVSDT
ncbi:hypothetical protein DENIS_1178 [Desulfonema ishimotonii]|uniref:Methyltransferase type 11 domain-containing protein n=1 Tax=Desulfonema ishimotonii TaxID=45657 RepID=A0A401FTC2_9BACT|nr:class I SAM-dependent methyltransferase [Desulfonema ishimotonii]GBC60227.1 hypothetical protein DENIS_1178 [Desulfonema ishimotonii]